MIVCDGCHGKQDGTPKRRLENLSLTFTNPNNRGNIFQYNWDLCPSCRGKIEKAIKDAIAATLEEPRKETAR